MAESSKKKTELKGTERAAILLLSLGEEEAAQILKHLDAKDVQRVGAAMATLRSVPREHRDNTFQRFTEEVEGHTALGVGSDEYVRKVLVDALGNDKANTLVDRILVGSGSKGLDSLKWMDPRAIAEVVRHEHPQIVTIVLSYLDPDQAAEVLEYLPELVRADILLRMATLDGIQPAALAEIDEIFERQLSGGDTIKQSALGGIKAAANILNFIAGSDSESVMNLIRETDETLAQQIQDEMFVFDNLVEVDDRGIQELLREVDREQLTLAMKGADEEVRQKFFKNMSSRAAEMLADDIEARGPVRLSDVEAAQKEILSVARTMAEKGVIALGGQGESYV